MRKEHTYISPDMEVILIEVEQCIMSGSTEGLGDVLPEKPW